MPTDRALSQFVDLANVRRPERRTAIDDARVRFPAIEACSTVKDRRRQARLAALLNGRRKANSSNGCLWIVPVPL